MEFSLFFMLWKSGICLNIIKLVSQEANPHLEWICTHIICGIDLIEVLMKDHTSLPPPKMLKYRIDYIPYQELY